MRSETDKRISPFWAFIPLIFFAILGSFLPAGLLWEWEWPIFIAVIVLIGIMGGLLLLYLVYTLIKRRNEHFKRHQLLEDDIVRVLKSSAGKKRAKIEDKL